MNMSRSEKIVSGLAVAMLMMGFASRVFPKTTEVSPFRPSSVSYPSCSSVSHPIAIGKGVSFGRECDRG
jgi:hypothetical protein